MSPRTSLPATPLSLLPTAFKVARPAANSLYYVILVVEDDAFFAALTKRVLEALGYRVVIATTGLAASVLLSKGKFDLLVVDGLLPDTSGAEWLASLRGWGDGTPAILMSSLLETDAQAVVAAAQLGIEGAVRKERGMNGLARMVESLLGRASVEPEPETMPQR